MACHNDLRDWVANLAGQAFTPTQVRDDPKIYTGCAVREEKYKIKAPPPKSTKER